MSAGDVPPRDPREEPELDAQWRDIVARLGDLGIEPPDEAPAPPAHPRRRRDDLPGARTIRPSAAARSAGEPEPAPDAGEPDPHPAAADPGPMSDDPRAWLPDPAVEEADNHFVPPEPGPVFGGDPLLTMAWAVVVGAPTIVVVAMVALRDLPAWLLQTTGLGFLAAVGVLLWRMPHRRDGEDDDPGAVV